MAVVPDPKKLFLPDEEAIPSVLSDKFAIIYGVSLGFMAVCATRYMARRPILSGIQHHLLISGGLGVGAKFLQDRYDRYNADRDAMFRHYIELHPEDFPMPERKKVGDLFEKWTPIR